MRRVVGLFVGLLLLSCVAAADNLSFNGLSGAPDWSSVPSNYGSNSILSVSYSNACIWTGNAVDGTYGALGTTVSSCSDKEMAITFTPIGVGITLQSFDLASWGQDSVDDYFWAYLNDSQGNILWSTDGYAPGSLSSPSGMITLTPNVTFGKAVTLYVGNWSVGMNNIEYVDPPLDPDPVPAPEPATVFLLGSGVFGVWLRSRGKQS